MPTDREVTDAYSRYAEKWARRKKTGGNPAHEYMLPQMYKLIPDVKGRDVLCIGSGAGEECQHISSLGTNRLVGIDLSEGLVEYAKKDNLDLNFSVMDMEHLGFPDRSFDFVFSNLVFHYVDNWDLIFAEIERVLKPNGTLLFSTDHPVKWGAAFEKSPVERSHILGYKKFPGTQNFEVYGDYLNTRLVDDVWFDEFHVRYYHRSLESIMTDVLRSGMQLTKFLEPKPVDEAKEEDYVFWAIHQKIPTFIIMEMKKVQNAEKTGNIV